jgi:ABC-type multidrug transport system fused ATPase/permease subunit
MKKFFSLIINIRRGLALSLEFSPNITLGLFVLAILSGLIPLLQAKILGEIVNHVIDSLTNNTTGTIILFVSLYALVWGATRIIGALQLYFDKIWHMENEHGLELVVLKKRSEIDLGHYEDPDFQDLLTRSNRRGIWPILEMSDAQFQLFSNLAVIIVSSVIASAVSWEIYLITIISSIPSFIVQFKYGYKMWTIWAEHSERQRKYGSIRSHLMGRTGVTQAKILQNSDYLLNIISGIFESFRKDNRKADRKRFIYQIGASLISALGLGLSLWLIARNVISGKINIGEMVFIISALGQLVGSLNSLLAQLANMLERNLYVNDIFKVLDTKPFIKRSENPVKLRLSSPPIIEFKNVGFKYGGREDWILKNVNLVINPGEKIALVGMNGAGKSTLIKLISRIYDPIEGEILINGINLKELDLNEWSAYLSVLLQDYVTYDLTVKESIGLGRIQEDMDVKKVEEASQHSGAHEFIKDWDKKYDQQLGKEFEGGIEPSKGQLQKIALARTIYRHGFIMILDEPTAAIDALSETKIFEAMERAVGKNTLIVITHRFNTTQGMDKIVVLDKGTVVEIGTHKDLLNKGGLYKEMFESQAKAYRSKHEAE